MKPELIGPFVKSTFSGQQDNCVEVAPTTMGKALRDSKDKTGPILFFTQAEWSAFVAGVKSGEFGEQGKA